MGLYRGNRRGGNIGAFTSLSLTHERDFLAIPNNSRRKSGVSHQSEITREQLSLPLASPPSPSGIRGILWVVQSIDLWLVSRGHLMTPMKYSDRHLAGLSARPPDRVELIGAGSLGYAYGTGPSFG